MKTIIVALASLLATVITVSGQTVKTVSEQEVWSVIMKSKEANALHGISNPNQILPGQVLSFRFKDGFDTTYIVEPGDFQCRIVRRMLETMPAVHGLVVNYDDTLGQTTPERKEVVDPVTPVVTPEHDGKFFGIPWWGWLIIAFVIFAIHIGLRDEIRKVREAKSAEAAAKAERERNPATAGPAMYPGGVTPENAHAIALENAHRNNPMHNIEVLLVEHGTLDSHGQEKQVGYADIPRLMVLRNTPGIRATVRIDGAEQTVFQYSVMGCGNNIPGGGGMNDDGSITFTLRPNSQPLYTAPVQEPAAQQPEASIVEADSSVVTLKEIVALLPDVFNKAIDAQTGIDVTFTVTPEGKRDFAIRVLKPGTTKRDA
jgi:hypothetical protein